MTNLNKLQQWLLYTPVGRYVLRNERIFYCSLVHNIFGYYSLQLGLHEINLLQGNKIPNHYVLNHDINCDLRILPFANNSIDLIICPHALEITNNYEYILSECYRILIPTGKLIITGFNRQYMLSNFNKLQNNNDKLLLISPDILSKKLKQLNFSIEGGKFLGYRPPINNAKVLSHLSCLDKIGDRWFPTMANIYGIVSSKDNTTLTTINSTNKIYTPDFETQLGTAKICKHN